jgi:hypothetical protein
MIFTRFSSTVPGPDASSPVAFTSQPAAGQPASHSASGRSSRRRGGGAAHARARAQSPAWTPAPATDAPAPEPAAAPHAAPQDAAEPACWCPSALWPFGPGSRLPEGVRQELAAAVFAAAGSGSDSSSLRLACKGAAAYVSARTRGLTVVGESGARDLAAALRGGRFGGLRALRVREPPDADASVPIAACVVAELLGCWQLCGLERLSIDVSRHTEAVDVEALALSAARLRRLRQITITIEGRDSVTLDKTSALEGPAMQASGASFAVRCAETGHADTVCVGLALALAAWPQMQVRGRQSAQLEIQRMPAVGFGKPCVSSACMLRSGLRAGARVTTWLAPSHMHSCAQELHLRTRYYTCSEAYKFPVRRRLLQLLAGAPLPRLARLVVTDEPITDHAGLLQLSAAPWAPQLRSLELCCGCMAQASPDTPPQRLVFKGLQALTIHHGTLTDAARFAAAELPSLRSLVISQGLADGGVTALFAGPPSWASSLQALDLSHNVQLPGSWAGATLARAPLHALRTLRLRAYRRPVSAASLPDDTIQSLARAPWLSGLTELTFAGQALMGQAPAAWAELAAAPLSSLRRLELRWCAGLGFDASAVAALAAAPWLRCLELLDVTGAPEEALSALRASAAFRELQRRHAVII